MKLDYVILVDISEVVSEYDSKLDRAIDNAIGVTFGGDILVVECTTTKQMTERYAFWESEGEKVLHAKVTRSLPKEIGIEGYFKVQIDAEDIGALNSEFSIVHFKKEYVE